MIVRIICGILATAMILAVIARPPATFGQVIGALLPTALLLGVAISGTGRSRLRRRPPP